MQAEELLGRPVVRINQHRLDAFARGKAVLVTGGGGSIGSELCRVLSDRAARLMVLENSEPALYGVLQSCPLAEGRLGDIRDMNSVLDTFEAFRPDVVFHAAALKHVPILERNWQEAIRTNVFGTVNVANAAFSHHAHMVLISTDKAVAAVSMLGATKRMAEHYCRALDSPEVRFVPVRFGNVLGSVGSVVPFFKMQIQHGGPVTITHPEMMRYFMTIREACDLVVAAASHALEWPCQSYVYVLNMGEPVSILDMAKRMIAASGKNIVIECIGMRPGERLTEALYEAGEVVMDTKITGVSGVISTIRRHSVDDFRMVLDSLQWAVRCNNHPEACRALHFRSKRADGGSTVEADQDGKHDDIAARHGP